MKKITMIVPCYNDAQYIDKCLTSLLNQSSSDFVAIIIDDGSIDESSEIIQQFVSTDPDKFIYVYKENGGIASVRNLGLSLVKTKYFGFIDSDDYLEETMIEQMINKMESDDFDVVVCKFKWIFDDIKKNKITNDGPYTIGSDMLINLFATLWNKVYNTKFVKDLNIGFPDNYRYEDASFLYKITPHITKIGFVDEALVNYVQRDGSITHTHNSKVKDMIYVFEDILNYYKANNLYEEYKDELEFLFVKFFLGNSFLRTTKIKDKHDRELTLQLSWDILNNNFNNWKNNKYIKTKSFRNVYYKSINKSNYKVFAKIFNLLYK